MSIYVYTTSEPVVRNALQVRNLRMTPGTPWVIECSYVRGFLASDDTFTAIDGDENQSINVSGAARVGRLEGVRDDIVAASAVTGATVQTFTLVPPRGSGAWRISVAYSGATFDASNTRLSISDAAVVGRLERVLEDTLAALEGRGRIPAGSPA